MEKRNYRELRTQPEFLKLLFANIISRFGDSIDVIAYSWVIYEITGSESLMALLVGLNYLPTVFFTPFAGAIVDKLNKKRVMCITDILRFLIVICILFLYITQYLNTALIICATLITSFVECFRIPASGAITPMLLDKEFFKLGKGASYSSQRSSELIGYLIVGTLIDLIGVNGALLIDAITFLISAFLVGSIKYQDKTNDDKIDFKNVSTKFKEGIVYAKQSNIIKCYSLNGIIINFGVMSMSVFQVPYVADFLKMEAIGLSGIKIAMTIGMMTGSFITPKLKRFNNSTRLIVVGIGMGICLIGIGAFPMIFTIWIKFILVFICMFGLGFGGGILNVTTSSCLMKSIPTEMMGRISGVLTAMVAASMPIASFICSALALKLTVLQILIIFGIITIIAYGSLLVSKKLKCFDD